MDEEDQTLDQATAPIVDNDLDPPAETDGRPAALDRMPGASVHDLLETSQQPLANPFDSYDRPVPPKPASPHTKSANPFDAFDAVAQRQQTRNLDALPEFSLLKEAVRARDLTARIDDAVGRDDLARQARQSAATLDPDGRKAWLDWEAGDAAAQVEQWQNELRAIRDEHGSLEAAPPSANLPGIMDALQKAQSRHTIVSQMQEDAKLGIERTASPQMQAATARTIDEQELRLSYQQDVLDQAVNSPVRDPIAIENAKANVQFERAKLEKLRTVRDAGEQRPAIPGATGTGEFVRQFTVGAFATVPELLGGAAVRVGQDMGPGSGEALEAIGQLTRDFGKQAKRDTPAEASPNLLDLDWQKQSFFTDLKLYLAGKLGQGLGTSATVIGAAAVGGLPAAGATSVGMGVGQMQNAVEEAFAAQGLDIPPDKVAYNVYLLGTGVGLLESVTELWALKGLMGAGKDQAVKSLAASLAKGVAKGAAIEGVTEGLQELLEIHGVADATGRSIDWTEARRRIIEATAAGAIPGAALGGITAKGPQKSGSTQDPPPEPVVAGAPVPVVEEDPSSPTAQPEKVAPQAQTPEQAAPAAETPTASSDVPRQDATSATSATTPTDVAPDAAKAAEPTPEEATAQKTLTGYLDSQGSLAKSDLPALADKLGVTPEELPKLFEKAVADGVLRKTAGGQYRRALPSANATYKMGSPEAARAAIEQAIGEISKALPKGTKVKVIDTVEGLPAKARDQAKAEEAKGGKVDGATVDGDIYLMSKALNPQGLLGHEGWHAVEARGLATPSERKVLAARAAKLPDLFDRPRYESAYAGRANLADLLEEEAAAHMVEARINGDDFGREINGILDRIIQFLERLANALTGKGFQTADDVIEAFLSGEVASRQARQEFMQANDITAMATDGKTMFAFAGERAKTADPVKLGRAKTMDAAGLTREAIWTETGWFKGVDGKWRFEIDDSGASLGSGATLGQALSHEPLMNAYPSIRDYEFDVRPLGRKQYGAFSPGDAPSGLPPSISVSSDGKSGLSSTLHEVQHGIQADEGFSKGANQFGMSPEAVKIYKDIRKRMATPMSLDEWATSQFDGNAEAARASYKDYRKTAGKVTPQLDRIAQETAVEQAYRRSAGETEARAVQTRLPLTADQRVARPPWLDYDVPEDQQIVRYADGVPMSAKDKSDVMFALRSSGLDPSPEARKARAEEMGFDTSKVWYHVTDAEFDQFSNDVLGGNTARTADSEAALESARLGTWFTTEPERVADMTVSDIEGGRTIPAYVRGNFYDKDGTIDLEYVIDVLQKRLDKRGEGAAERWRNDLIKKGYDGIRVIDTEFGGESLIVFDPKNIRSVNAMFDPDKAGSANLMFALRDRLGFARNSPELRSMNALVRDLAFDLGITVRRGFKTTQSKIAKSAAKQAGDTLNAFYDPMTGVLRLQKFNDVSGVAEVAGNILKQRHGKAFQTAADRVNQAMKDELYHLNFERTQFPIRENNLAAMREELATIEAQGWMKDSMETQQRGATLRRDIPLREADLEAARAKIAALEVLTKEAPRVPEDMGAWFQTYLMNPQAASIDPFTDVFEAALDIVDPALLGKIEGAQQSVSAYAKANAAEVMTSMIVPSEIPGAWDRLTHDAERFGWKMALGMRLSDLYGAVYANDHPFYLMSLHLLRLHAKNTGNKIDLKAIDHPAKLWRISAQARAWANRDLDKGIRPADSVDHAGPSMMDVLTTALGANRRKAVDTGPGSRYRDFGAYLMARMGVERWTRYEAAKAAGELGQLREPYAVPKSIMITAVQDFEVKYPSFAAAAQMLYAFQRNLLTLQRDKGLISEETYQALQAEKNYVPSLRSFEDEKTGGSGQTAKKGEAAIQDVIKRFRGSQRDVIDPISSIALKVFKTRADIAVNDTIQKLLYLAEQAGPGGGLFAERLDARQAQAVQVDLRQALKNAAKEANLSENDRAALVDLASEMLGSNVTTTMFTQGLLRGGKGEPVVYMREAGKIVPIRLGKMGEGGHASARLGKQVWDLLNTYGETHTNFVLQMMALPAQIIRTMVVSHPSFMLANIIRDAPAAWGYDPQALPIWTQLVGSFDVIRGAEYVERYRSTAGMMGGEATQLFDQFLADHDVETLVRKGYRFASFNSFSNGISFLSDAFSLRNWPDKAFGATMGGIAGFSMAGPVGGVAGAVLGGSIGGKAMAAAGELTETATRSRLWKHAFGRAKAAGLGDVEAAAEAAYWAHAYGDYSRHGLKTDVVRKWVPFLNANLQANDAFFQRLLAKGDYGFEATKYVPGQVALWPLYKAGVLQLPATLTAKQREELAMSAWAWFSTMAVIGSASMVYALMYRDDDRIKMLPENLRANHWNIPLDDLARAIGTELPKEHRGKHFARIPKPFERAIVANTIERLTMEYARGNPRWLEHWLSDIYEVTKPPLMPTALDLPAQLLMNRDSFSGREIVPRQGAGQRMRSEMFDEYTSQFARWLGGQLDLAPQQVDFMIAKLGSTWGRDATRANIPGAPWFDPKAPTQGLDEKFIASRFLYKIGKGTEAEKAFREVMGGEDPLPRIWEKIAVPYNRLDAQAESYKFLKDRLRQDAKAMGRLDSMTASERGYALLEGHWQGSNAKYQQLHPMKRAETVSQLVSQMQKELIGDHSTAGKKGPRQTILDLSPDEKQAARDALTQYKAMEVYNALVLTGEKGWQNRGYLPAKGVLDELATGVPEIAAEFQRRLEKAHVLPFEGVRTIWPRVKEKLESQELLRRIKDKDTIGLGALLAAEYGEARFP